MSRRSISLSWRGNRYGTASLSNPAPIGPVQYYPTPANAGCTSHHLAGVAVSRVGHAGTRRRKVQIEQSQTSSGVAVLAPKGRLDYATGPTFIECVREVVGSGSIRVVADFREVSFADSSGINALISGLKTAR